MRNIIHRGLFGILLCALALGLVACEGGDGPEENPYGPPPPPPPSALSPGSSPAASHASVPPHGRLAEGAPPLPASASRDGDEGGAPLSATSRWCLSCHAALTPGIVDAWRRSRHARVTPRQALGLSALERRMSAAAVAPALADVAVGCYECHGLRPAAHGDAFPHNGQAISVVVSPADCAVCHPVEAEEFGASKKAHAWENLAENPFFTELVHAVTAVQGGGPLASTTASVETLNASCGACHGRPVTRVGTEKVERGMGMDFPVLANWPNQGVGRVNPDGSKGNCSACHARHSFSIEVARKAETCSQCHLEPDFPAWEVWRESKHGNLVQTRGNAYDWTAVPWVVGRDFRAPSCAACHVSLVTRRGGAVVARRSHRFDDRLWVRLAGFTHATAQTRSGATHAIRNADGQPLPSTMDGRPASAHLIDEKEQAARRERMEGLCLACHATSWVRGHWARLERTVAETNAMVTEANRLVGRPSLTDEDWVSQWLFHANSVRYGAAMAGADHVTFKNGWWKLSATHRRLEARARMGGSAGAKTPPRESRR